MLKMKKIINILRVFPLFSSYLATTKIAAELEIISGNFSLCEFNQIVKTALIWHMHVVI